jgi:hypothetical protein
MKRLLVIAILTALTGCTMQAQIESKPKDADAVITVLTNSKTIRLIDENDKQVGSVTFINDEREEVMVRIKRHK